MQKILPLLMLATVFCPLSRATTAATIVISPSSDRTGEDLGPGPGFENLRSESETNLFPSSPNPGLTEGSRAGLEFALSGVPVGATINSATLSLVNVGFGGIPVVEVHGYAGNGAVELADMTVQNQIAGPFSVSQLFDPALAAIDTTSFVQQLITNDDSFAGFTVRITSLSSSLNIASKEHPTASFHPTLTVDYTPTPVPEPGSLLMAGFGITWGTAVSWVRRKRRRN